MTSIFRNVYMDGQRIAVPAANPSIASSPRLVATGNSPAVASTDGNDTTPVVTEMYLAELYVPSLITTTGIALFNGSVVAGNITLGLYDSLAYRLGQSASTAQAGTDAYQLVPLALTLTPGTYFIALQCDDVAARFNSHIFGTFGAGKLTGQTYGTMPSGITLPTTFTTALGPIASLY